MDTNQICTREFNNAEYLRSTQDRRSTWCNNLVRGAADQLELFPVDDDLDQALQVDVLAAALRSDHRESADLLDFLARMLEESLPGNVTIVRDGWFMSKTRPVRELTVRFNNFHYQIVKEHHGVFCARAMKLVKGVVLKTTDISMDECIDNILRELAELAERNAQARRALNKFVLG